MKLFTEKTFAALCALCMVTGLCACSEKEEKKQYSPISGLVLELPDGYTVNYPEDDNAVYDEFYTFNDTVGVTSVYVTSEENTQELSTYFAYVTNQYSQLTDYKFYSQSQKKIGGFDAIDTDFEYCAEYESGTRMTFRCYIAIIQKRETAYVVTCVSPKETFSKHSDEFKAITDSVVFVDLNK